jgi:hypothetical protein
MANTNSKFEGNFSQIKVSTYRGRLTNNATYQVTGSN